MGGMWIEKPTRGRVIATVVIVSLLLCDAIAGFLLPEWVYLTRSIAALTVLALAATWLHVC
jgi:hypothetical protein